jgi:hypothetical protein
MKTIETIATELIAQGAAIGAAYAQAAATYAANLEAHHRAELLKTKETADKDAGLVNFLGSGLRLKGLKAGMVSPSQSKACTSLDNGALIEPANYDQEGRTFFPPKLWVLTADKTPWFLNQNEAAQLLEAETREPGSVLRLLNAIGSAEKVKEYADEKKRLIDAKLIKTYDTKTKTWV